jgi:hypothetical protein
MKRGLNLIRMLFKECSISHRHEDAHEKTTEGGGGAGTCALIST